MKEIKQVLNTLITESNKLSNNDAKLSTAVIKFLQREPHSDNDLELFFTLDYRLDVIKEHILEDQGIDSKNYAIIKHYDFVKNIISDLIQELEGRACCADKASSIIKLYVKEVESFDNSKWYLPSKGDMTIWKNLIESILMLQYGKSDNFIVNVERLKTLYKSK